MYGGLVTTAWTGAGRRNARLFSLEYFGGRLVQCWAAIRAMNLSFHPTEHVALLIEFRELLAIKELVSQIGHQMTTRKGQKAGSLVVQNAEEAGEQKPICTCN